MSLTSEMSVVVHSLASARSARRQDLERIRSETWRYLADASTSRHQTAVEQAALRSEALRSTRLATAMVLGAANEMVDEFSRQRGPRTIELRRNLADGVKQRRAYASKWLSMETAVRRKTAVKDRRERVVAHTAMQHDVAAMRKRHRIFLTALAKDRSTASKLLNKHLADLTKDRNASLKVWYTHIAGNHSVGHASPVQAKDVHTHADKHHPDVLQTTGPRTTQTAPTMLTPTPTKPPTTQTAPTMPARDAGEADNVGFINKAAPSILRWRSVQYHRR
jgi:hypothetical protein